MIQALHTTWQRATGLALDLNPQRQGMWEDWTRIILQAIKHGDYPPDYTCVDALKDVISWRKGHYKYKPDVLASVLAFRHLVGNADYAEEDLAAYRASLRHRPEPVTERDETLYATGRPKPKDSPPARSASKVMVGMTGPVLQAYLEAMRKAVDEA